MRRAIVQRADVNFRLVHEPGTPSVFRAVIPFLKHAAVRLFIEAKADVDAPDDFGNTPLMRLLKTPLHREDVPGIVADLLEAKVKLNDKNADGMTALDFAVESAVVDLIRGDDQPGTGKLVDPALMLRIAERLIEAGGVAGLAVTREDLRRARIMREGRGR